MSGLGVGTDFEVHLPPSVAAAIALQQSLGTRQSLPWLAGGQSLLASIKMGLNQADGLINLQAIEALHILQQNGIGEQQVLRLGAMVTHARVSSSQLVREFCPGLSELAGNIADQQIRNRGTLGGSLANNDPAACWPAAALALNVKVHTNERIIAADDYFQGMFSTALNNAELLLEIRFTRPLGFKYLKIEQPASRFALVGVAVAKDHHGVRVALTGLGYGVQRWPEAEQALSQKFDPQALVDLRIPPAWALSDLHASADYRAHLGQVLCRRAVAQLVQPPSAVASHSN